MKQIKKFYNKNKSYFILSLIVTIIFLIILFLRRVYPFSDNLIAGYDFFQGYIPVYYKFYDLLHGSGSILYDWNLGAGLNCYGSLVANALLSPISWLIYFSPRDMIPQFLSIIFLLKNLLIAILSYYSFNRLFPKVNNNYKIVYSILYSLGGYILIIFPNLIWFESIALFPLIVVGMKEVFDNKKSLLFVISLTLSLIYSYYISYMILFFMLCAIILGLIFYKTDNKKEIATKFVVYILSSLCMSFFSFLPSFMQSMSSYRMSSEGVSIAIKSSALFFEKLSYYLAYSFVFINFFRLCITIQKDKKNVLFFILLLLLTIIGVFIEPINKMWHTGSYQSIPQRYAFIPIFVAMLGGLYYLENNKEKAILKNIKTKVIIGLYLLFNIILIFVFLNSFKQLFGNSIIFGVALKTFILLTIMFIINCVIYLLVLSLKKKYLFKFLFVSIFIEIILFSYACDTIQTSNVDGMFALDNFPIKQNDYRYKVNVKSEYLNYAYLAKLPLYQNWLHIIPESQVLTYDLLGYNNGHILQFSSGGTYFSDLLLGNKYISSVQKLNSNLYNLIGKDDDFYYYEMKYSLPVYFPLNSEVLNDYEYNTFDYQNQIYQKLFNKNDNIINEISFEFTEKKKNTFIYNINYDGQSDVYFYISDMLKVEDILLDGKSIKLSQKAKDYFGFFTPTSEDSLLEIKIYEDAEFNYKELDFYTVDIDKIISLTKEYEDVKYLSNISKNKLNITFDNKNNYKRLFVPINYNEGFVIKNNGEIVNYERDLNNYISISLTEGENNIVLKFIPPYFKIGVIVSITSLVLFILFSIINNKFNISNNIIIKNIFFYIFILIEGLFFLKVYIMSILK